MKTEIITHVELQVNPDFVEEVLPLANETRKITLLEDGCKSFMLTRKINEPNTLVIFAVYTSKQAYEWHLGQDYIKGFFSFLQGKLMKTPATAYLEEV
jgi:quinol monooxygenase YgiN